MFYYFGRKGRLAGKYPAPIYDCVIEPFAGSAAYSLYWKPEHALLMERDARVVRLWHRLIDQGVAGLRAAAPPTLGERTNDLWYLTAMASKDSLSVREYKVSNWAIESWELARKLAIRNHEVASRFDYAEGDYRDLPDDEATWFIDPPYQHIKRGYKFNRDTIDYDDLAEFCRSRKGQVIVCEQEGADWLPFRPLAVQQNVQSTGRSHEMIWTGERNE